LNEEGREAYRWWFEDEERSDICDLGPGMPAEEI
jgi:hypothetical protein